MTRRTLVGTTVGVVIGLVAASGVASQAQTALRRPVATLTPRVDTKAVRAGSTVVLAVRVALPEGVHVQSNKPRDPGLIATVLTVTPPAGLTLVGVRYPKDVELAQRGAPKPLLVYPNEFDITVELKVGAGVAAGKLTVPATLRYQACNETLCFIPTNAATAWTVAVTKG